MIPLPIRYIELENVYTQTFGSAIRSVAVTAPQGGEGVSTLAYALARRAAAADKKALLEDRNLARPSIAGRFALQSKEWSPEGDSSGEAIEPFPSIFLSILPAPKRAHSWAFRDAQTLRECIERWTEDYDFVVIDTSPINRSNQGNIPPDLVCAACDATVLVALSGRTTESQVIEARGRLVAVGARLTGGIMNDRYMPHLADELCRETYRLERWLPNLMEKLRIKIRKSPLLNLEI